MNENFKILPWTQHIQKILQHITGCHFAIINLELRSQNDFLTPGCNTEDGIRSVSFIEESNPSMELKSGPNASQSSGPQSSHCSIECGHDKVELTVLEKLVVYTGQVIQRMLEMVHHLKSQQ